MSGLKGKIKLPGDKSISQRAILIGSLALGKTIIKDAGTGKNIELTVKAMQQIGVDIRISGISSDGKYCDIEINGKGPGTYINPSEPVDCGGSATLSRMLTGMACGLGIDCTLTGNIHLQRRPMSRVTSPLCLMGADFEGDSLPLKVHPAGLHGISYKMPMASSQVKSAILLAGIMAEGITEVTEPSVTRNHTEIMLSGFGGDVKSSVDQNTGLNTVTVKKSSHLTGQSIIIPGDFSSAAFFITAALIIPDSDITLCGVGYNETRTGFYDIAKAMGGHIDLSDARISGGETVCDIHVTSSALKGINVFGELISRSIDELPLVAVLGAFAKGQTVVSGAGELRIKECDRIAAMTENLKALGVDITETMDGWVINGCDGKPAFKEAEMVSYDDHRIAMCIAVARLAAGMSVIKDDCVSVSYPGFYNDLETLCDT